MSEPAKAPEQQLQAAYVYAAEQMNQGVATNTVRDRLIEQGMDADTAATVVDEMKAALRRANQDAGRQNMIYGALWCIGGTVVTVVTYQAAAAGGRYVVAWGAIAFGGFQFLRGLIQYARA